MDNILSLLIWLPIVGAVVVTFLPRDKEDLIRYTSAGFTGIQFIIAKLKSLMNKYPENILFQKYDFEKSK